MSSHLQTLLLLSNPLFPPPSGTALKSPPPQTTSKQMRHQRPVTLVCSNGKDIVPNTNYVVPLDKSSFSSYITRPLVEILRDLNKRIPEDMVKSGDDSNIFMTWYHANRMLSFHAPGWCGEVRDVIFSDNGSVTVVYRVTIRGSDGEAHRESTGTVSSSDGHEDPVAAAEEIAFCKACARFGLGLYLYHEE